MKKIRKAYPTDAYSLITINDIVWKDEFYDILPNGILNTMLRNTQKRINHLQDQIQENNRIFVALEDDKPIGYIFYAKTPNAIYNTAAEIRSIYILPEFQHQGIGSQLFENVLKELNQLGYKSLIIYCPLHSRCIDFFLKLGGEKKEVVSKNISGYNINCSLIYFDLETVLEVTNPAEWNTIYSKAQENLSLLNDINREIAVISSEQGKLYLGLGIKNHVCPIESALSNMYIGKEKNISKILILNRQSKPVLPCGKCRDLLISLGQDKTEILFDIGNLQTMTMKELNPYYKDKEKV